MFLQAYSYGIAMINTTAIILVSAFVEYQTVVLDNYKYAMYREYSFTHKQRRYVSKLSNPSILRTLGQKMTLTCAKIAALKLDKQQTHCAFYV